ncbi:MAG: class I SAM-dependent methyltransferase [Acidobacteria bacterium]|nr:MAG: class I SAM-dependent methyltransferase [Acidobacteriota bacterium]
MRHTNYDEVAATYDRRYADEDYAGIEQALVDFLGDTTHHVLEVGCGTGYWLQRLRERNAKVHGIDPSWEMLSRAQAKLTRGRLSRARGEALPFRDASFDRLFCINALHHFGDKRRALEEARRALRPGGGMMTVALDPHTGRDRWWVYDYFKGTLEIDKQRYPSCQQIRDWMDEAGFVRTYTREVQHLPGDVGAQEALRTGLVAPGHTSQLAVLTRAEFAAGVARIRTAIATDSSSRLTADLRVYATYGSAPEFADSQIQIGRV